VDGWPRGFDSVPCQRSALQRGCNAAFNAPSCRCPRDFPPLTTLSFIVLHSHIDKYLQRAVLCRSISPFRPSSSSHQVFLSVFYIYIRFMADQYAHRSDSKSTLSPLSSTSDGFDQSLLNLEFRCVSLVAIALAPLQGWHGVGILLSIIACKSWDKTSKSAIQKCTLLSTLDSGRLGRHQKDYGQDLLR